MFILKTIFLFISLFHSLWYYCLIDIIQYTTSLFSCGCHQTYKKKGIWVTTSIKTKGSLIFVYFYFSKIFRVFSYFEDNCFYLSHFPISSNINIKLLRSLLCLFLSHIYTHRIPDHFWPINKWLASHLPFLINISFKMSFFSFGLLCFFCYLFKFIHINF